MAAFRFALILAVVCFASITEGARRTPGRLPLAVTAGRDILPHGTAIVCDAALLACGGSSENGGKFETEAACLDCFSTFLQEDGGCGPVQPFFLDWVQETCRNKCVPNFVCPELGTQCGHVPDGCGGTLDCQKNCYDGDTCSNGQCVAGADKWPWSRYYWKNW